MCKKMAIISYGICQIFVCAPFYVFSKLLISSSLGKDRKIPAGAYWEDSQMQQNSKKLISVLFQDKKELLYSAPA